MPESADWLGKGRTVPVDPIDGSKLDWRSNAIREAMSRYTAALTSSLIDEILRQGAGRILAEALRGRGRRLSRSLRRGTRRQRASTNRAQSHISPVRRAHRAGSLPVLAPWVNDKRVDPETGERQRFSSAMRLSE